MTICNIMFFGYGMLVLAFFWLWATRPLIGRKYIIRNNVQAQVDAIQMYTEADKLVLILQQFKTVDFSKLTENQKKDFFTNINRKNDKIN